MQRKLTDEQVAEIRQEYSERVGYGTLAARYGVSETAIRRIVKGEAYANGASLTGVPSGAAPAPNAPTPTPASTAPISGRVEQEPEAVRPERKSMDTIYRVAGIDGFVNGRGEEVEGVKIVQDRHYLRGREVNVEEKPIEWFNMICRRQLYPGCEFHDSNTADIASLNRSPEAAEQAYRAQHPLRPVQPPPRSNRVEP